MDISSDKSISRGWFGLLLAAYLAASAIIAWYFRHEGLHSDAVAYISLARKYAQGNFKEAVNGFWSPLFSWLLAPFIKAGINPLYAARMLNIISGIFILAGVRRLSALLAISEGMRRVVLAASAIIILSYSAIIFPDMMLLAILIYYLALIFRDDYPASLKHGAACGILGAVAYYSKNYAFPFFTAHFLLFSLFHYLRGGDAGAKMRVLKNAVAGMAFFMMMSGLWIYAISSKYGHVTVGTAGSYNFSQISPELPEMDEQPEPVLFMGLMEPPNRTAVSIMEDPTYIDVVKWSPFESAGYFIHFVKHITGNIYAIIQVFNKFSLLSGIIVLVYLALLINSGGILKRPEILYPLSTLLLFCGGYTPFIININNERYIWLANILLLFMGGHILSRLFCSESVKMNLWKNLLILIFALSFLRLPLGIIKDKPLRGEENLRIFRRLEPSGAVKGRIASNDKWGDTLQLAYYSNLADNSTQYIGIPKKPGNELEELKRYDIDVYLYWEGESEPPEFLSGFKEITEGRIPGVKAYRLK